MKTAFQHLPDRLSQTEESVAPPGKAEETADLSDIESEPETEPAYEQIPDHIQVSLVSAVNGISAALAQQHPHTKAVHREIKDTVNQDKNDTKVSTMQSQVVQLTPPWLGNPARFSGTDDKPVVDYVDTTERTWKAFKMDEEQCKLYLEHTTDGPARQLVMEQLRAKKSAKEVLSTLKSSFADVTSIEASLDKLERRTNQARESILVYARDVLTLCHKADPGMSEQNNIGQYRTAYGNSRETNCNFSPVYS